MRLPHSALLRAIFLAAVLTAPLAAVAIEAKGGASQSMQELVAAARELLPIIRGQARDVDIAIQRALAQTGDTTRMLSNSYEYRELKRSASELSEVSNKIYSLAARCGADGKKVGQNFKGSVRHLASNVNRIGSSSTTTFARMAIGDLERDLQKVAGDLQVVAGVPECSPESQDDQTTGEGASKSE